jgi:hypothetical protein
MLSFLFLPFPSLWATSWDVKWFMVKTYMQFQLQGRQREEAGHSRNCMTPFVNQLMTGGNADGPAEVLLQ